jgi:hypothetical protein
MTLIFALNMTFKPKHNKTVAYPSQNRNYEKHRSGKRLIFFETIFRGILANVFGKIPS